MSDKQKAIELLKEVINQATKAGLFPNVDTVISVANAFNVIQTELTKDDKTNAQ